MVWFGLACSGLVFSGLVWSGLVWSDLVRGQLTGHYIFSNNYNTSIKNQESGSESESIKNQKSGALFQGFSDKIHLINREL